MDLPGGERIGLRRLTQYASVCSENPVPSTGDSGVPRLYRTLSFTVFETFAAIVVDPRNLARTVIVLEYFFGRVTRTTVLFVIETVFTFFLPTKTAIFPVAFLALPSDESLTVTFGFEFLANLLAETVTFGVTFFTAGGSVTAAAITVRPAEEVLPRYVLSPE